MSTLKDLKDAVMSGEEEDVAELTQQAIDEGIAADEILNDGLIAGMNVVGKKFKDGEMFVPEVLMTAAAMKEGVELIRPLLGAGAEAASKKATIVLATVEGDLHDIGKNLVVIMFDSQGYNAVNAGMDVPPDDIIQAAIDNDAQIIGLSALLTTTMPVMKEVVDKLKERGLRDRFKVIIGGAPVTQEFSDEIGADGYSADAQSAVDLAESLLA
jgi:5-methyltetrahydrofolate--homocysteine methyltransferase